MSFPFEPFVARLAPLETAVNRAWWDAAVSGRRDAYDRLAALRDQVDDLYRDPSLFSRLSAARDAPPDDPIATRAIEILYLEALPRQVDGALSERINRLSTDVERGFSVYRPAFDGQRRTANDLDRVLRTERDEGRVAAAYEALKSVGPPVAGPLAELVELRNQAARAVGYADFYHLRFALLEQDPTEIETFFDRLDALTAAPFAALKDEIDERLGERFGLDRDRLRPWHYGDQFFQEVPEVYGAGLDEVYTHQDVLEVARRFFAGIGLPVDDILARSSLYEAEGKDPHAFATDIDRRGDVRILLNLRPNERWMGTTLHELGHAVYETGIDLSLPWVLRRAAHTLTTEAIAMLFGRLSRSIDWMRAMGVVNDERAEMLAEPVGRELSAQMLVFTRWVQVMTRFERGLYADPTQDLNALWWSLVERFQGLVPPPRPTGAADYAAKIHVVAAPVYYHNYMLGECFASQLDRRLRDDVLDGRTGYAGKETVGEWLTAEIFRAGARLHYQDLARAATGAPVGPDAFADQFLSPAAASG